jgi:phosphatidylserine decarboxylase
MADRAVGIPIAREGVPFVAAPLGAGALAAALGWPGLAIGLGGAGLFAAWFFRNPRRVAPGLPGAVVAPGDGRVIAVEEEFEPRYLKDRSVRVSIFLNIFDVHVNRMPCAGTIEDIAYQPGQFLSANRSEATLRNEQNAVMIRAASGSKVLCVQVAGLIARRIVCWAKIGDAVACGERFGLIRFGSRMDTFLPLGTRIAVAAGDPVKGGETLLGELSAEEAACVRRS